MAKNGNNSSGYHLPKKQRTEDKIRSLMLDMDVLDCPVCYEPFTIPIFQCENGHMACSSCCPKLGNKCPACALPIGHYRCRAMESILESAFLACRNAKFGCTHKLPYGKELTHEKECIFSQFSCPAQDCTHSCSYKDIFDHYNFTHVNDRFFSGPNLDHLKDYIPMYRKNRFNKGSPFSFQMNISDMMVILRDSEVKLSFAVQCFREPYGVYVTVSCIAPPAPEVGRFSFRLSYTVDGHTMTYESPEVKRILKVSFQTPQDNVLLIPNSLLRGELLEMNLCIKKLNQE
ncbi:unnamed protein product [Microthlaspi erraticum]|uniref:RING-type E3 ubiquitin transferase n=1 Tax=Microthlaspi erraticum TaxID=1685480 RepID=A0A6D2KZF2_9BRAS|nr:unnamed protein product [Microthlaspi erraticum]